MSDSLMFSAGIEKKPVARNELTFLYATQVNWKNLAAFCHSSNRAVFRTLLNIYDSGFFVKIVNG